MPALTMKLSLYVRTTTLMDGSIALSFQGYQATKSPTPRRMSNFDTEGIQNEGEEEFAGVFIEADPTNRWEALGQPDKNPRWDILGELSGRYDFYVNYAAPPPAPFIPPTRPTWDDDDDEHSTDAAEAEVISEAVFPSIWEDTPWEEDPYLDIYVFDEEENSSQNMNESHIVEEDYEDEEEEDLSVHFLGLENLENDYPISPNTVLPDEQHQVNWDDSSSESENYWQNIVEQVEHMEEQYFATQATERMGELSIQEISSTEDEGNSHTEQPDVTNEIAHAGIEAPLIEQLEGLEYPILRSMMNQAINENAFPSTSAISRYNPPPEPLMGQINNPPAQTLNLKKAETIPPYDKGEQMIEELIDYTNYLQSMVDKGKQLQDILYLRVRRLTQTAKVPVRRTLGAAGYDIFTDEEVHIMPRQQCLVKTGISLEFSKGHYARIAPRSGSAYKLNFIVNAGVIDSDFRGELVFEKIMTPPVMEVNDLRQTIRGTGSFGSTEIEESRSSGELIFSAVKNIGNLSKGRFGLISNKDEDSPARDGVLGRSCWSHIPNLSKILGPLYSKTSPHGDQRFKESDWAIIRQIKSLVQSLSDLELPPNHVYVIIETDGSMEGWGGVCVDIKFEHISGMSNELADALSRLVHHITNKASLSDNQRQFLKQVDESMDEMQGADDTVKERGFNGNSWLNTHGYSGRQYLKEAVYGSEPGFYGKLDGIQSSPGSNNPKSFGDNSVAAEFTKGAKETTTSEQPKLIENRTEVLVKESRIQIERIEEIMQESVPANTEQILSLTKQLEGLTLGKPRKKEPFYVYQDPLTSEPVTSSQEDQIRSYRRMARFRYEAQRRLNHSRGTRTLESQLNPEAELELSQRQKASLVQAETLYSVNWSEPRNAGVNALIVLRDTRWRDDRSIIATMEVDLSRGIHAVSATPRTIAELQGMKWILQPPSSSQIRNPQEARTTTLMDGSIALSFQGYQATKNPTPRRMSNFDTEGIQNEGEEEFAGVFIEADPTNRWEALGQLDTNPIWDTLGEPSGRYDFYVNYAAPPPAPFIPPTRPTLDDHDDEHSTDAAEAEVISEAVFPSIWEDTPWEEDPYLDIYGYDDEENYSHNMNESHIVEEDYEDEEEEDLSVHFLGLENLENDYPISPNTVLPDEQHQVNWDDSSSESENYWQNIVEQVEHMEEQYFATQATERIGELSIQEISSTEDEGNSHTKQPDVTNEIAHAGIEAPLIEQLEGLEYPILRCMMNQAINENAFSSTSVISRYNPPPEPLMGQINYPPAQVNVRTAQQPETAINGKFKP
ncbi:hypothetical protein ZIOFF_009635 [Zingiber officinale]|uniref:dUTP diphosphatase n=1 Tax=Zingiber officinale TaxID=94328 RepID=A0A8J5LYJ0_ZINOF|nr:hypothetical protein ZIOFF_009635 [Zingiber officinale]